MRCEYRSRNAPLLFVVGISSSPNEVLFCLSFFYMFLLFRWVKMYKPDWSIVNDFQYLSSDMPDQL